MIQGLWGASVCFIGSIFNWGVFAINLALVVFYLVNYFWCMVAEFFSLLGIFLTRLWSYISLFLNATATPGAAPGTFLGVSVTPIFGALSVLLSNSYIGAIATIIFSLLTFSMWRSILKNLSGKKDE